MASYEAIIFFAIATVTVAIVFLAYVSLMKPKKIIAVVGAMGSGKSTFCKALLQQLGTYHLVCLDDIRNQKFEDLLEKEHDFLEWEKKIAAITLKSIEEHDQIIYESTGSTRVFAKVLQEAKVKKWEIFMVNIKCPYEICLSQHRAREETGHFHIIPQYKKERTPEESVEIHLKAIAKLDPDLELDSTQLSPDQMVMQFMHRYQPSSEENQIREIIHNFHYATALKWVVDHVPGKQFVKDMLKEGEDSFNRIQLKKLLTEHLEQLETLPQFEHQATYMPARSGESTAPESPEPMMNYVPPQEVGEESPLKDKWKPLFIEAHYKFLQLDHTADKETRKQLTYDILNTMDEVQRIWEEADFIKTYGTLPQHDNAGLQEMAPSQLTQRKLTLRTYITKLEKGKLMPKATTEEREQRILAYKSEMMEIERLLK